MPLFKLTDIKIKGPGSRGPLAALESPTNQLGYHKYPDNLGQVREVQHFVQFNIFKRNQNDRVDATVLAGKDAYGEVEGRVKSLIESSKNKDVGTIFKEFGGALKDSFSNLNENDVIDPLNKIFSATNNTLFDGKLLNNRNESVAEVVRLYMPSTVAFQNPQNYTGASVTGALGQNISLLAQAGGSALNEYKSGNSFGTALQNMSPFAAAVAARLGGSLAGRLGGDAGQAQSLILAASGAGIINPHLELLYTAPTFRTFQFDFAFYPRSQREANEVQNIIDCFHFHSLPEFNDKANKAFLVPPSEFEVSFHYGSTINKNIRSPQRCVLTGVDIDYAPNGFHTYETPDAAGYSQRGGTGMPVGIRMQLSFQETVILTKELIRPGKWNAGNESLGSGVGSMDPSFMEDNYEDNAVIGGSDSSDDPTEDYYSS